MGSAYENLIENFQGKMQLGTFSLGWKGDIKMDLTEM
jgi:hypothetical protein